MAELGFDNPSFKSSSIFDMDQLRLEKDERARIAIIDEKAKMELVHWINGDPRGRYYVCLGDYQTVQSQTSDPDRCPACSVAEPGRDTVVSMPRRRFVLNVARYRTNSKGQVLNPLSLALQAWVFSDDKYNKLVDRHQEHGDLRRHDITLTCTAKQYQSYDIDVSPKLLLQEEAGGLEQYKQLRKETNADVSRLLGTTLSYERLEALVSDSTPPMTEAEQAKETAGIVEDVMAELSNAPLDTPMEAAPPDGFGLDLGGPTNEESESTDSSPASDMSFDDLLES
jgi:hypothetical protein